MRAAGTFTLLPSFKVNDFPSLFVIKEGIGNVSESKQYTKCMWLKVCVNLLSELSLLSRNSEQRHVQVLISVVVVATPPAARTLGNLHGHHQ